MPPLLQERQDFFNRKKNPYFEHAEVQLFLAERAGIVVGRICAHIDKLVQIHYKPGTGQWGLFECDDNPDTAKALIAAAEAWLKQRGMTLSQGPMSMSVWDEPGLQVSGFDKAPILMTGHHQPRYQAMIEHAGYAKIKDLWAYGLDITKPMPERIQKIVDAGDKNPRITIRNVKKSDYAREVAIITDILNDAWSDNWGYIPLTDREKEYAPKQWLPLITESWVKIAEYEGEAVGFMVTLPNLNEMIDDLDGKLFPFGWAKLLWRLKRKKVKAVRVPIMGVRKSMQTSRHGALMVFMMIEHTRRTVASQGGKFAELSWILEDNGGMNNMLTTIGCEVYKTYRIYEREI